MVAVVLVLLAWAAVEAVALPLQGPGGRPYMYARCCMRPVAPWRSLIALWAA